MTATNADMDMEPTRPGGPVAQRRRRGSGRRGETRSMYLSPETWHVLEALGNQLGWTVSRTADRLLALAAADHVRDLRKPGEALELNQGDLVTLAYRVIALDMGQSQGVA